MFTELMRWTPFDELLSVGAQLDRQLARQARQLPQIPAGMASVDIQTQEDGWHLRVPVPGVAPEDVDIRVSGRALQVIALERDGEQTRARYEQTITVPETVDVEKIAATCRHGLLDVHLPLKEAVKPRRIEVSTDVPKRLSA